ncbi:amylo-alpha-1,6-glucosidase [Curtobacterium sp. Csp1]|uniref:amylo-alpha-1,6-glucosidase n=1 Tax=unclassified Curtobacterium TaxID=257496 RepID=UPI001599C3EB|nr:MULTISPECIES: glycogen debranching N-terminal domain-containing protein [unclassified Curtobacterium]QKS12654.1 amylo-alpha-1,6-glucosidase [Curtobacterium sp. csp3]QKS20271.1 amylo-alpha-1,6-glucosidase [Curtobacterium sp. Csp1]
MTTTTTPPDAAEQAAHAVPRQPLLHDEVVVLAAPTQAWSDRHGDVGTNPVHGYWTGDQRVVSAVTLTVAGSSVEPVATVPAGAREVVFTGLLRGLDGPGADPDVRLDRIRTVRVDGVHERLRITDRLAPGQPAAEHSGHTGRTVTVRIVPDASGMDAVKAGAPPVPVPAVLAADGGGTDAGRASWTAGSVSVTLRADGATVTTDGDAVVLTWSLPHARTVEVAWDCRVTAPDAVAVGATTPRTFHAPQGVQDDRLRRWLDRAVEDLDALRLRRPEGEFLAAGAPWFFTLFGRDSLWAARFLLPVDITVAGSTLRVLAALQGTRDDPATAEQPGKIPHELRQASLPVDNDEISLPPLYYGTVDATPLWICTLHDAWRAGLPEDQVRALLPALGRALAWMRDSGDADGDGLLEYVDESGRGLANQGWKDSGDSVQWRDGRLADGPIALCEVQGYAHEAAVHGADLLDAFGLPGGPEWRAWAARLADRFRATFWVTDAVGPHPAIALDARKHAVDSATSNIGHLLGTGLLDEREEAVVAARVVAPDMASGFGLRTLSTTASGYWPLSYHGGSVWAHDTAVVVAGLTRSGFRDEARALAEQLLAAAVAFDFRMPELHAGDAAAEVSRPAPYPAACRPQAWSAAAVFPVWVALR